MPEVKTDEDVTFPKMDPVLKAAWLKALRDGSFKQGRQALRTKDGCHCCLGVLACLIDSTKWSVPEGETDWHWQAQFIEPAYDDESGRWDEDRASELPTKALDSIGLDHDAMNVLMVLNDGKTPLMLGPDVAREPVPGKSFAEIADWIEAHL